LSGYLSISVAYSDEFTSEPPDGRSRRMQKQNQPLDEMVKKLPLDIQEEVRDFIEFLLEKRVPKSRAKLKLDWRGALRDLRDKYTSVELQHKALEWWGD
jgi:hypothetical protein